MTIQLLSIIIGACALGGIIGALVQARYFTEKADHTNCFRMPNHMDDKEKLARAIDYMLLSSDHHFEVKQGKKGGWRWFRVCSDELGEQHVISFSQRHFESGQDAENDAKANGYIDNYHLLKTNLK